MVLPHCQQAVPTFYPLESDGTHSFVGIRIDPAGQKVWFRTKFKPRWSQRFVGSKAVTAGSTHFRWVNHESHYITLVISHFLLMNSCHMFIHCYSMFWWCVAISIISSLHRKILHFIPDLPGIMFFFLNQTSNIIPLVLVKTRPVVPIRSSPRKRESSPKPKKRAASPARASPKPKKRAQKASPETCLAGLGSFYQEVSDELGLIVINIAMNQNLGTLDTLR